MKKNTSRFNALEFKEAMQEKFMKNFKDGFTLEEFRKFHLGNMKKNPNDPVWRGKTAKDYMKTLQKKEKPHIGS